MTSRWKKIWVDFWGNKSRSILTILTILVGTVAVGFNVNLSEYMLESMDEDYLSSLPSEALISAFPLDDDLVKAASEVPGVDAVEGRNVLELELIHPSVEDVTVLLTKAEDPAKLTTNRIQPVRGESTMPPLGDREILIDSSAEALGYKPGDTITVELEDGKRRDLILAGYIHDVTSPPYAFSKYLSGYITANTFIWMGGPESYNLLAVSVAERQTDAEHVTAVAQAVADRLERGGATVNYVNVYQPGHHFAYNITQGVFFVLGVLGYLTVVLSSFLIVNTITALMTQQTRQIGIMKAIGGMTSQVFVMYLVLILILGLIALLIGIPLAGSAAEFIGAGMSQMLNFYTIPFSPYPSAILQQFIVAIVVPFLAALWPIYNSVRITVREAISDYGLGGNPIHRQKEIKRTALVIPRPMRLSLRNVFRRRLRLILTLISLILAGSIFIGVYNLWASFDKTIEEIQRYILADVNISFNRYYRIDEVGAIAGSIPGVVGVEGWTQVPGTLIRDPEDEGMQIMFVAPPSTSTLIDPVITGGRWLTSEDENAVVVEQHLTQVLPDLKLGDWLNIKIDDQETRWQIIGFYTIVGNVNPPLLYVNYEYISRLIGRPGQVYSVRVLTEEHDALFQRRISDQIISAFQSAGIQVGTIQLGADFINSQSATTDIFVYFMLVMAGMIAIVGGLGLAGTMSINVLERTREIGVMRAIGASNADIQSIVVVEGLVIGIFSWAISMITSIPITVVLCWGVGMAMLTAPMPSTFVVDGILVWLLLTVFLSIIASALPARQAARLTVRDTLAYE